MEREKNERLTTEEKLEEEKMKKELTDIGIYEEGITYGQMKQIIGFINESKDTSNAGSNIKNTQKGTQHSNNECLLETNKSDTNTAQEDSQEFEELSRPSISFRTSSTISERKTVRRSNSPESPSFEIQNPTYKCKNLDDDGTQSEKQHESTNSTHSTNRYLSLRSGNILRECQNTVEKNADVQGEVVQKLERWQLNPLDVCDNENDVPLRQPNRPLARERAPFEHCKAVTIDECEQLARTLSQHLKEMADLWYSWRPSSNSVFQWGSPIQVGTANNSSDRTSLTDSKTEQIKAEYVYRDSHERVSKRKANYLIREYSDRIEETDDEEDKQHGSARVKKKKQSNSKSSNVDRAANQLASHEKPMSNTIAHSLTDNNNETETSVEHKKFLGSKRKLDEQDRKSSPELGTYPRRIVPPIPKRRLSLSRLRKGNAAASKSKTQSVDKSTEQTKSQSKNTSMTDEEIRQELLEDWQSDKEDDATEKNVVIRPLPLSKEVREKLLSSETMKKTKTVTSEGGDRERNREKKLKLDEEQKKQESDERIENRNGNWEHQLLLSDDDDDLFEVKRESNVRNKNQTDIVSTSTSDDKVNCPICNKLFSRNEIEGHAADCDQFEISGDEADAKNLLECTICNKYKTSIGTEYEDHVRQCINEKKNKNLSHESEETASTSFRTFTPISELKDSEIDYLNQFSSNKQTNIRKRKR